MSYHSEAELIGLVKSSTAFLASVLAFYEELLASPLPRPAYSLLFCDDVADEWLKEVTPNVRILFIDFD